MTDLETLLNNLSSIPFPEVSLLFSEAEQLASTKLENYVNKACYTKALNLYALDLELYGRIIKVHPEFVIIQRGPFIYTVFIDGIILIENPDEARLLEVVNFTDDKHFKRAAESHAFSWTTDYIITIHGEIIFRESKNEFYKLKCIEALNYAIYALEA